MSDNSASWQPDPSGKHDHRYWDGTGWTDHVADGGVAGTDPYEAPVDDAAPEAAVEPEAAAAEEPTVVTPVAAAQDTTAAYPTPTPGAPLPYLPPTPVASGGGSGRAGRRGLVIGGAILAAVALAVVAFLALSDDDEPTAPVADESEDTTTTLGSSDGGEQTLEDLEAACAEGDFRACDDLYFSADFGSELEEFGSTCGGVAEPQSGSCEATNGGEAPFTDGLSEDDLDDLVTGDGFGLTEEQAECIADQVEDIVTTEGSGQQLSMAEVLEVFAECDISLEEISAN